MTGTRTELPSTQQMVRLSVQIGADQTVVQKDCALLVIACDPRNLLGKCDYGDTEKALFTGLSNFTFHTTLLNVKRRTDVKNGEIFAPDKLNRMAGDIYGYRNESVKTFQMAGADEMVENLLTVYQLQKEQTVPWTSKQFEDTLVQQIKDLDWWPFGRVLGVDYTIVSSVTTPYFDHYVPLNLKQEYPWKLLDLQWQRRTIFAHAAASFESVLDVWAYGNLLFDNALARLPDRLDAPIIILGAGASGLLMALRLIRANYTNIEILELSNRNQGKTHTLVEKGLAPPGKQDIATYCELGTCYMSPAYAVFRDYLGPEIIQANRSVALDAVDSEYRAIVTDGQFPKSYSVDPVMYYNDYIFLKAAADIGLPQIRLDPPPSQPSAPTPTEEQRTAVMERILSDLYRYAIIHQAIMGNVGPMPTTAPSKFLKEFGDTTMQEFLNHHQLQSLTGIMQYGYSVQGYGALDQIPAYYGLVWVTPATTNAIMASLIAAAQTPPKSIPVVTAWSLGWGNIFDNLIRYLQDSTFVKITHQADTAKIDRPTL